MKSLEEIMNEGAEEAGNYYFSCAAENAYLKGFTAGVKAAEERAQVEIDKLTKQIKIMRDALEFYADGFNWEHKHEGSSDYVVIIGDQGCGDFQITSATDDEWVGGRRARQALKQAGEV